MAPRQHEPRCPLPAAPPPSPPSPAVLGARPRERHRPRVDRAAGAVAGVPPRQRRLQRGVPRGRRPGAGAVRPGGGGTWEGAARGAGLRAKRPAATRPLPPECDPSAPPTAPPVTPAAATRPCARRWATKQRTQRARGELAAEKEELLAALGFEFDEDEAEWLRWFLDLARWVGGSGGAGQGLTARRGGGGCGRGRCSGRGLQPRDRRGSNGATQLVSRPCLADTLVAPRFKEVHGHASPMQMSTGADL
jgi:hypothetical protein